MSAELTCCTAWDHCYFMFHSYGFCRKIDTQLGLLCNCMVILFLFVCVFKITKKPAFMALECVFYLGKIHLQMFIITPLFHWTFWKIWSPKAGLWIAKCHCHGWVGKGRRGRRGKFLLRIKELFCCNRAPVWEQRRVCAHSLGQDQSEV